jgi:hypothetical protein
MAANDKVKVAVPVDIADCFSPRAPRARFVNEAFSHRIGFTTHGAHRDGETTNQDRERTRHG